MPGTKQVRKLRDDVPRAVFSLRLSIKLAKLLAHTAIDLDTSREALVERILEEHIDQYVAEAERAQE